MSPAKDDNATWRKPGRKDCLILIGYSCYRLDNMSDFTFIDHSADAINEKNRAVLAAEEALLERLALEDPCFFGAHPSYVLPMRGVLGSKLNEHPIRTEEGGIINRR